MRRSIEAIIVRGLIAAVVIVAAATGTPLMAAEGIEAIASVTAAQASNTGQSSWFREITSKDRSEPEPPSKLAIIACRVEAASQKSATAGPQITQPDWLLPLECMRVIESVTDAAAMTNLWLRQRHPNLAQHGTCAEVAMDYAPKWEESHRNWLIVKIGCPVKIVDADGRTIGWHMPECQGTLPGTTYPLRCRFDPSEI